MAEQDDKLDVEAIQDKNEAVKDLEKLSLDPDSFEDIEREFRQFMDEIVGQQNLKRFKDEYQKIFKTLKTSYQSERKIVQRCKTMISEIWEKATNVKSAIRMAQEEVDKIQSLKIKVEEEQIKLGSRKEDEKTKQAQILKLKLEIEALDELSKQPIELQEEYELKQQDKKYEEMTRLYEEQLEKMAIAKAQHKDLEARQKQLVDKNMEMSQKNRMYNEKIMHNALLKKQKDEQKQVLIVQTEEKKTEKANIVKENEEIIQEIERKKNLLSEKENFKDNEEAKLEKKKKELMSTKKMLDEAKKLYNKSSTDNTRNTSAINDQKAHKQKVAHEVIEAQKDL